MAKTYSEKLRDPRWQKVRLEIMERDNWACQECFDTTTTLNVHHLIYEKGVEPWQYADIYLITLCENCHQKNHSHRPVIESDIIGCLKVQLKDMFILKKFYDLIQSHYFLPELTVLMDELGQTEVVTILMEAVEKQRAASPPPLKPDLTKFLCPACGSRKFKDAIRYQFLECAVCSYSFYYAKNPDYKTSACS